MTAELVIRADPAVWTPVPAEPDAAAWYERQLAAAPETARDAVAAASLLALQARLDSDLTMVLLLCDTEAEIYTMLGIAALADVPAPDSAAGAAGVAEALLPSPWPAEVVEIDLGVGTGWRATVLDPEGADGDDQVTVPQTVSTAYVLDVRGRCVVAALSPLPPLAAAAAQVLAQRALATLDVEGENADD